MPAPCPPPPTAFFLLIRRPPRSPLFPSPPLFRSLNVAILANHFNIPFYVAAPLSTIDLSIATGSEIPIELRDREEVTSGMGRVIAPKDIDVYNPAFDVTPNEYVTAIVTEKGAALQPFAQSLRAQFN